jgi:lipopolysaccharide export system permease protein
MTRFDRFIIGRVLMGYLTLIGVFIVFFVILHFSESMDDFHDRGAPLREVFLVYYPSYMPDIVRLVSPLAIFLSCIYWTARLAQSLQLVSLHASGVSLRRIMLPFVIVGLALTSFHFWFNGWVVPHTNRTVLDFEQLYLRDAARSVTTTDIHRQNRPGSILTVSFYDRASSVAHRVSLQDFDEGRRMIRRVDSNRMEWLDSLGVWRLREPVIRTFDTEGLERREKSLQIDTTLNILPQDLARTERDVESMTVTGAALYIDELRRAGVAEMGRTLVGYYAKFAYPFANIILVLIAVPLAAVRRRGGQAAQIGLGFAIAFIYLALQKLSEPFGYSGDISPVLTAWLPHAVFALFALVLLLRARR